MTKKDLSYSTPESTLAPQPEAMFFSGRRGRLALAAAGLMAATPLAANHARPALAANQAPKTASLAATGASHNPAAEKGINTDGTRAPEARREFIVGTSMIEKEKKEIRAAFLKKLGVKVVFAAKSEATPDTLLGPNNEGPISQALYLNMPNFYPLVDVLDTETNRDAQLAGQPQKVVDRVVKSDLAREMDIIDNLEAPYAHPGYLVVDTVLKKDPTTQNKINLAISRAAKALSTPTREVEVAKWSQEAASHPDVYQFDKVYGKHVTKEGWVARSKWLADQVKKFFPERLPLSKK